MIKKILFIDDDPISLQMGEMIIKNLGYIVLTADGGLSGLEILVKEEVDLIFLDLMMPDIYGLDVLKKIKESSKLKHIPVVVQTGVMNKRDIDDAYALGAHTVLSKPYSKSDVKEVIESINL